MIPIITTNPHDNGFDLVAGTDVTGRRVGNIFWDATGPDPGFVLKVGIHGFLPNNIDEVVANLAEVGYDLTDESRADIAGLVPRCEAYARKGTGTGICDRPVDGLGQCDRASDHIDPV